MGRCAAGNTADPGRLERVLNAKQRLIGVDVAALDAQVAEKAARKAAERAAERSYAEATSSVAGALAAGQQGAAELRKDWDREGKATTREWDLNRPDARAREAPARLGDADPRCGPASLQRFDGEDLEIGERTAAQREQCKAWWEGQAAAKAAAAAREAEDKQALGAAIRGLDSLQCTVAGQEAAARAELARQVADANQELRALQAAKRDAARQAELAAKLDELAAATADPWLREDPGQAASALSPARVRRDHWKGMSPSQRSAIQQEQLAQVEARHAAVAAAAAAEAARAAAQRDVQRAVLQQAQAADAIRRAEAAKGAAALREQMAAKAARDAAARDAARAAGRVDEAYFVQFGRSAR
ncbi:RIBC2 [Scenedesmus sp. PABB004]|nr:RIBC2 [Scenedesmus sp. PABB004]